MRNFFKKYKWFLVGLLACLITTPNNTVMKFSSQEISPNMFNIIRFGFVAAFTLPLLVRHIRRLKGIALKYSIISAVFMCVAVIVWPWAIAKSTASYASVLTLLSPVIFIILSVKIDRQSLNRRSLAGISLAATGAFLIVAIPILINQPNSQFVFYPFATLLIAINLIVFPLAVIYMKKAHQAGVPLVSVISLTSWITLFVTIALMALLNEKIILGMVTSSNILAPLYSGFVVGLMARFLNVISYEKIGSVATSALGYVEVLGAVLLPVIILGETLSWEMVVGGVLILLGVYFVEHHKSSHHKFHHSLKHH
ncbi:MAG: hypothetical protein QG593_614 [Patescibacteria group bacterium]|nr:hypothetical protein [Patescibacteria group bacterium]